MLLFEILDALPDAPYETRRFAFMALKNRRFMFEPKSGKFLIGAQGRKNTIQSSHAEEYYDIRGTNRGFDAMVRGWMGVGGGYRHGIIHFAPPIANQPSSIDAGLKTLQAFVKCGANGKTVVRGFPGAPEQPLGAILCEPITESLDAASLRDWFAGSKIVDDDNQPLVVHHFTYNDFEKFDRQWAARRFNRDPEGIDTVLKNLWKSES